MLYEIPMRGSAWLPSEMPRYKSPRIPRLKAQLPLVTVSCTYSAISFTFVWPRKKCDALAVAAHPLESAGAGRERSMHANSVEKFELMVLPGLCAPPHCAVLVTKGFVSAVADPSGFANKHGEFSAGSTIPKVSFSVNNVCWKLMPAFRLCLPCT